MRRQINFDHLDRRQRTEVEVNSPADIDALARRGLSPDIGKVLAHATTIRLKMEVLQRRIQGKPGHQSVSIPELIRDARALLAEIENEVTR
jgi:hypothetical protein